MPRILVTDDHATVRAEVSRLLFVATQDAGYTYSPKDLSLKLVENDRIVGGLTATTNWNWLYIETLAVDPEYQRRGFARGLVLRAEEIACQRGCLGSWVDTFTFQVPEFYQRLGYEPFGELPHYPAGQSRIFLRKLFRAPTDDAKNQSKF